MYNYLWVNVQNQWLTQDFSIGWGLEIKNTLSSYNSQDLVKKIKCMCLPIKDRLSIELTDIKHKL